MTSDWVAYVGPFMFPTGQAGSRRVYGVASSLVQAGYHVVVGSGEPLPKTRVIHHNKKGGSLSYLGLSEIPDDNLSKVGKITKWLIMLGDQTIKWLDAQNPKPTHVILYGSHSSFIIRLLSWCRRHQVALILDLVEWYDPSHVSGGILGPINVSTQLALRMLNTKSDGVIAISTYLENYYRKHKCNTLRVPVTLDTKKITANTSRRRNPLQPITLAYTGVPGKKDLINEVIEAILQLDQTGQRLQLIMAGPQEREILQLPAFRSRGYSLLPDSIKTVGQKSHQKALKLVENADFMPLLRPLQRFAQAGFPTKVAESLAVGTPVICNITSDLGDYIHDGKEGLICQDYSVDAFKIALERVLSLSSAQISEMRRAARVQAEQSFDYRVYAQPLARFFEEVKQCKK